MIYTQNRVNPTSCWKFSLFFYFPSFSSLCRVTLRYLWLRVGLPQNLKLAERDVHWRRNSYYTALSIAALKRFIAHARVLNPRSSLPSLLVATKQAVVSVTFNDCSCKTFIRTQSFKIPFSLALTIWRKGLALTGIVHPSLRYSGLV